MERGVLTNFKLLFERTKECNLLIVEDHDQLRINMAEVLEGLFKEVVTASDGMEGLKSYDDFVTEHGRPFDVVITDIKMPRMDGVELCRELRQRNEEQQIIVLSAHTDKEYLLELINLGIAQFINKPIEQEKMLDALSYVCKKVGKSKVEVSQPEVIDFGENVVWDIKKDLLIRDGVSVHLTQNEILLMRLLIEKSGQICTTDDIMYYFDREGANLSEKSIRNLISKLRKKLPDDVIEGIYGMGYKLLPGKASL